MSTVSVARPVVALGDRAVTAEAAAGLSRGAATARPLGSEWSGLYRAGAGAAATVLALMPVQIVLWVLWPPPETVAGHFAVLRENALLGLVGLDLFYMATNVLMLPLLLALGAALWRPSRSLAALGLTLGLVSIAVYFASTVAIEMLLLSGQYAAGTDAERAAALAAGGALLVTYKGTAFAAYYLMNGAALLCFAAAMLRSNVFGRATAVLALLSGVLMVVPSTFGTVGMVFSLASLVPWAAFSVLIVRGLWRLGKAGEEAPRR